MSNKVIETIEYNNSANYTKTNTIVSESYAQFSSSLSESYSVTAGGASYAIDSLNSSDPPQIPRTAPDWTLSWGSGQITLEAIVSWPAISSGGGTYIGWRSGAGYEFGIGIQNNANKYLYGVFNVSGDYGREVVSAIQATNPSTNIVASGWVHVAIVAESGNQKFFVNGTLIGSRTDTVSLTDYSLDQTLPMRIGCTNSQTTIHFSCSVAQYMMSDNIRYSSGFTPPTQLTADANTVHLFNFNEGSGGTFQSTADGDEILSGSIQSGRWSPGQELTGTPTTESVITYETTGDIYQSTDTNISGAAVLYNLSASYGNNTEATTSFQLKNQNSDWLVWDTGSDAWISASYNQRNDLTTINNNIATFPLDGKFNVRVFFDGNGSQKTEIDNLTLTYYTGSGGGGTTEVASVDYYKRNLVVSHLNGNL